MQLMQLEIRNLFSAVLVFKAGKPPGMVVVCSCSILPLNVNTSTEIWFFALTLI